jgi:Flp pilus assembly protein TadB
MEGRLQSMEDRFDRVEQTLDRIDQRLARIEARDSQLTGAWWVLAAVGTVAGAVLAYLVTTVVGHFWK